MISIVTVSHNSYDLLTGYVASFLSHNSDLAGQDQIEFILVENSGDDRIEDHANSIRHAGFPAQFKRMPNRGFGSGCNEGASLARGDLLVFANPDIRFQSNLAPLSGSFGESGWGTVQQRDSRGRVYAFDLLPEYRSLSSELIRARLFLHRLPALWRFVYPVGSFFVVPRSSFIASGGFDERFFLYYEEAELSRRLQARLGKPIYCSEVSILHDGFGTQTSSEFTYEQEAISMVKYASIVGQPALAPRRVRMLRKMSLLRSSAGTRASHLERVLAQVEQQN